MCCLFRQIVFAAFLSILVTGSALAEGALYGLSGAWYNPEQPGHGLSVEVVSPERAVVFWNTFDPQGNPIWLHIDGAIEGSEIVGDAYYLDGMVWGLFDPSALNKQSWGTVNLVFSDCNSAAIVWNSEFPEYGQGQLPLIRLTSIHGVACHQFTSEMLGYFDVVWTETDTQEEHYGKAIIDTTGFMTTVFVDPQDIMEMFGQVLVKPFDESQSRGQVDMDVTIKSNPNEVLSLSGQFDFSAWPRFWVESDADSFEFTVNEEWLDIGTITQETLVGEWWLEFAGETYEVEIGADGKFEWTMHGTIAGTLNYEMTLTVPPSGAPILQALLKEDALEINLQGNAVYDRSSKTGQYSIEIRAMDWASSFRVTLARKD